MNHTIIAIGKLKEKYLSDGCEEYLKRLSGFGKTKVIELPAERLPDKPSEKQIQAALETEGSLILSALHSAVPGSPFVCAMCVEGKKLDSLGLAQLLREEANRGRGESVFVIGGSFGLSRGVKDAAGFRLSMSDMTFPHQLARLMLLEQLYRAETIIHGRTYHK